MKKTLILGLLLSAATAAMADFVKVEPNFGPFNAGVGGEFTVLPVDFVVSGGVGGVTRNLVEPGTWQTFCLETHETLNTATYEATPNTMTENTGTTLTKGVAYLYDQFMKGILTGYDYGAGRLASAAALQNDIWFLMGEGGAAGAFAALAAANVGPTYTDPNDGTYPVAVLNLWRVGATGARDPRQDILVPTIPDGGLTVSLLGMSLVGLGFVSRRFRA